MTRKHDPLRQRMMRVGAYAPGQRRKMCWRWEHEPLDMVLSSSAFARATEFRRFCRNVREGFALVDAVKTSRTGATP